MPPAHGGRTKKTVDGGFTSMTSILWLITILLGVLWFLGYAVNIGAWINFLLIVAVILLVFNIISWMTARGRHTHYD